jgi:hypothetical protein
VTAPERPASERLFIEGGMLVEDVGHHTCGAGGEFGHEPSCGLEPVIPLDDLDVMMRAGSRFAARIVGDASRPGNRLVELWTGERYTPGRRGRRPFAVVELPREEAEDLVLALQEPAPYELPEHERPPVEPLEGL